MSLYLGVLTSYKRFCAVCGVFNLFFNNKQEGRAVASIARDDPSTLPGDDPFPRVAHMHRDHNAR